MSDDKTPPAITNGSFVSWSGGKGRVDLLVSTGKVPGVEEEVEATSDSPAARVVVWEDGKPTRRKIAASTHTLKRIAPLDGSGEKSDPAAALVALHGNHALLCEEMQSPPRVDLTGVAIKAAYDRGVRDWPGETKTALTPEQWGIGRAEHLCKAARGEVEATNDWDLLAETHPQSLSTKTANVVASTPAEFLVAVPEVQAALDLTDTGEEEGEPGSDDEVVEVNADDLAATLAAIDADSAEPADEG